MPGARQGASVVGRLNGHQNDIRDLDKKHSAAISGLQSQQNKTAKQAADTAAVANASAVTTETVNVSSQLNGPTGAAVFGYTGSVSLPALNTDSNTGSSWATGERDFINALNANVSFILAVLRDNNIIGD